MLSLLNYRHILYYKFIVSPKRQKPDNQLIPIKIPTAQEVRFLYWDFAPVKEQNPMLKKSILVR